jgi:GrpB-like predicted nucleotidyltransferase (UPF0157 family)
VTDEIHLEPYDLQWPRLYERERDAILAVLPVVPLAIEHIGSTAVPGLDAKPIIDILVLVDHLDAARPAIPALDALGYSYWRDDPDESRLYFVKGLPPAPQRTHHLHIYADPADLERHVTFRDRLRADAQVRAAYLALKRDLASRFAADREAYTNGKTSFIALMSRPPS